MLPLMEFQMNFLQGFWNDLTLQWNIALKIKIKP